MGKVLTTLEMALWIEVAAVHRSCRRRVPVSPNNSLQFLQNAFACASRTSTHTETGCFDKTNINQLFYLRLGHVCPQK